MIRRIALGLSAATALWLLPVGLAAAAATTDDSATTTTTRVSISKADCLRLQAPFLASASAQASLTAAQRQELHNRPGETCSLVMTHKKVVTKHSLGASGLTALASRLGVIQGNASGCPYYAPYETDQYFDKIYLNLLNTYNAAWFANNWSACMSHYGVIYQHWHSCDGWTFPVYGWARDWCGIGEGGNGTHYIQFGFNWHIFPYSSPFIDFYGKNRSWIQASTGVWWANFTPGFPCYQC